MRISENKAKSAYSAIADPITDLRIENAGGMTIEKMDEKLFNLQNEIWRRLCKELNLQKQ